MEKENVTKALFTVLGTVSGGMASRVVSENIPLKAETKDGEAVVSTKKELLKHTALGVAGALGVMFLERKDDFSAFVQDMALGFSAVQFNSAVKKLIKEPKGVFKTALGSFYNEPEFLASYNDYDFIPSSNSTIDAPHEVVETTKKDFRL